MVKLLLEREEVNPDKPDSHGQTPLLYAAIGGHEGVVKLLLEREEVNPDKPDRNGQTPISLATERGDLRVIALLQSRKAVTSIRFKVQETCKRRRLSGDDDDKLKRNAES